MISLEGVYSFKDGYRDLFLMLCEKQNILGCLDKNVKAIIVRNNRCTEIDKNFPLRQYQGFNHEYICNNATPVNKDYVPISGDILYSVGDGKVITIKHDYSAPDEMLEKIRNTEGTVFYLVLFCEKVEKHADWQLHTSDQYKYKDKYKDAEDDLARLIQYCDEQGMFIQVSDGSVDVNFDESDDTYRVKNMKELMALVKSRNEMRKYFVEE